ncbi:MAG: tRNA (adenosine(37)-N6)-threonylcarbamoyltransferase complex dimerization subunit type 1 TsaB [Verrucomicrobia bacterium RIFCSPHIGHO2_12_FULL_41_10]|nr:MAG: tRNA (adenosine(37)-N6)-threonylcarbamoyltransferase complex dimerization subunit type 1 TsaB [Verrucomicrobia bacterium RIFCSPHIGHO2_12_FULL_41_10]HLB34521.1 tRNA (adenosine(37)-N6)-threonylcarbamoyltransferase complex dimerization subunit type 1 TsaB [Chthoniobacterales bacterium]
MKILALDASSPVASVAMVEFSTSESKILYCYDQAHERINSSVFFQGLEEVFQQQGKPDRIVVGLGPGSYNGLRASIAAAQGIASALSCPLVGIPSPLALPGSKSGYWACGDARGGQYWLACIIDLRFVKEPFLLPPSDVLEHLEAHPSLPLIASTLLPQIPPSQKVEIMTPNAVLLASLGFSATPSERTPEPLYLKPPSVTVQ